MMWTLAILLFSCTVLSANGCARGSFRAPGSSQCTLCQPGTYQQAENATSCRPCVAGSYNPFVGAQSPDVCRNCPAGTYSTAGSSICTPCPAGTTSGEHSHRCGTCPKGSRIAPWGIRTGDEFCETCPYGYADEENLSECKPCPPGSSAPPGSISVDQCQRCAPGSSSNGLNSCSPCSYGTVGEPGSTECRTCPAGSKSEQWSGGKSCALCDPGEYGKVRRTYFGYYAECHQCPENTTSNAAGRRLCRRANGPCPRGYLQTSSGDCERCNTDEKYDVELERCVPCAENEGSVGGLPQQCAPCTAVVRARIKNSKCAPKLDLEFPDNNQVCSAGYRIEETEVGRFCEPCGAGSFSARPNSNRCLPCPHGTVSEDSGAQRCERCPPGTTANEDHTACVVPHTNCPIGTFLHVEMNGYTSCVSDQCSVSEDGSYSCPPCTGSFFRTFSFEGCAPCPGKQVRNVDLVCGCQGVFAQNLGMVDGSCSECPVGSYGKPSSPGMDNECVQCPAGTYRAVATFEQLKATVCPRCSYWKACQKCPPGFVTRHDGATECEKCPEGTFSYGIGDTECLSFGSSSQPVSFNDALDLDVNRELERLSAW